MKTTELWILALVVLLFLLGAVCIYSDASEIQTDLQRVAVDRLRAAELSSGGDLQVIFDGRDALLIGQVDSLDVSREVESEIKAIWGVRTVDNRLDVSAGTNINNPAERRVASARTAMPFLEVERDSERVLLRGVLATEDQKQNLLATAADLFGADRIVDEVEVSSVETAAWQERASQLLRPLQPLWHSGRFRVDVEGIQLRGTTLAQNGEQKLLNELQRVREGAPLDLKIDVQPPPPRQEIQDSINTYLLNREVQFESSSAVITEEGQRVLDEVARWLYQLPEARIEVAGHTDSQGDDVMNQRLSEQRAEAVVRYLAVRRIASERMDPKGYGETKPIADDATPEGRQRNRRIEFLLLEEF